jgi:hypothetical protein
MLNRVCAVWQALDAYLRLQKKGKTGGANHPLRRITMADRLQELKAELRRLMREEIASLKSETFGGSTEQELRIRSERLNRIRELSADLLALLKSQSNGT